MKTKLTILFLAISIVTMAQVSNLPTIFNLMTDKTDKSVYEMFGVVPTSLSFNGNDRVYVRTAEDQVAIYSNSFTPVKQFAISPNVSGYKMKNASREVSVTVIGGELITEKLVIETWHDRNLLELYINCTGFGCEKTYNVPATWTENDIINYLESGENVFGEVGKITTTKAYPDGGTMFIWDMEAFYADGSETLNYWQAKQFGKKYPRVFYLWQNGYLYYCSNVYYHDESEYSEKQVSFSYGDWVEGEEYAQGIELQTWGIGFHNYDNDQLIFNSEDGDGLCLTQTLFNDDDQYEYLYFPISSYVISTKGNEPESPTCNDCYSESTTFTEESSVFYRSAYTGFNVMSETGSVLQSISFPNGFVMKGYIHAQIIKLNNEYYIICTGEMNDNATMLVYKINRSGSDMSVQQVSEPIKITDSPNDANSVRKIVRNGNVYILIGNKTYTLTGAEVMVP